MRKQEAHASSERSLERADGVHTAGTDFPAMMLMRERGR